MSLLLTPPGDKVRDHQVRLVTLLRNQGWSAVSGAVGDGCMFGHEMSILFIFAHFSHFSHVLRKFPLFAENSHWITEILHGYFEADPEPFPGCIEIEFVKSNFGPIVFGKSQMYSSPNSDTSSAGVHFNPSLLMTLTQSKRSEWDGGSKISRLINNHDVIRALSELTRGLVTQTELKEVLRMRISSKPCEVEMESGGQKRTVAFENGYNNFDIPKGRKWRSINRPHPKLREVQRSVLETILSKVFIHSASMGGEKKIGVVDNAKKHMHNAPRWAVQMDVQNAFPSTSAARVHGNLVAALSSHMRRDLSQYSKKVQEGVVDLLVTLLTYRDKLPQGAPTSVKLMNIVMCATDAQMGSQLMGREDGMLHSPMYTRYIDDLTLSWKEFRDMNHVWGERREVKRSMDDLVNVHNDVQAGVIGRVKIGQRFEEYVTSIDLAFRSIEALSVEFGSSVHRKHLIALLHEIVETLEKMIPICQQKHVRMIRIIQALKKRIKEGIYAFEQYEISDRVGVVSARMSQILRDNGWSVNLGKTHHHTPESPESLVVTGVSIHRNKTGIPRSTKEKMTTFFEAALRGDAQSLPYQCLTYDGQIDPVKIGEVSNGFLAFVEYVLQSDSAPRWFSRPYNAVRQQYFPEMSKYQRDDRAIGYGGIL